MRISKIEFSKIGWILFVNQDVCLKWQSYINLFTSIMECERSTLNEKSASIKTITNIKVAKSMNH